MTRKKRFVAVGIVKKVWNGKRNSAEFYGEEMDRYDVCGRLIWAAFRKPSISSHE